MPKVSVVIPNYNHARFLRQRIDTVLQQTFKDFEVILLDDCSPDNSREIISSYAGDPRVRIELNTVNSGSTFKQWNKGVRLAQGAYVWIAESDDYASERLLERLVTILEMDPEVTFAYCRSRRVSADGRLNGFTDPSHLHATRWTTDFCADGRDECRTYFINFNTVANASAVVFRKAIYESVGGADESLRMCGDWKLWAAMALKGKLAYLSEPLNYFRFHDSSVHGQDTQLTQGAPEALHVVSWLQDQAGVSDAMRRKSWELISICWTRPVLNWRVPLGRRLAILRAAMAADPRALRNLARDGYRRVSTPIVDATRVRFWHPMLNATRPVRHALGLRRQSTNPPVSPRPAEAFEDRIEEKTRENSESADAVIRAIAFHLPQFHPIPENDEWWGKGFTEWTNVVKAVPRIPGHYQPHLPADLGFYDLRLPEARAAQSELAASYGIYGFCYYHYWFNGRPILERPVNDIWKSGEPEFPFCLCWANENWTRQWDGLETDILLEQRYGPADDLAHIQSLIPMFLDHRYIRIDDRPLFLVYRASRFPEPVRTTDTWRREAERAGLKGLFLVRVEGFSTESEDPQSIGFDSAVEFQPRGAMLTYLRILRANTKWWHRWGFGKPEPGFSDNVVYSYEDLVKHSLTAPVPAYPRIPCVCPGWDNSPRRKQGASIYFNSTPDLYERWLQEVVKRRRTALTSNDSSRISEDSLVFINAWNEWGEGNHLEPCQKWGRKYLEATRRALGTTVNKSIEYAGS